MNVRPAVRVVLRPRLIAWVVVAVAVCVFVLTLMSIGYRAAEGIASYIFAMGIALSTLGLLVAVVGTLRSVIVARRPLVRLGEQIVLPRTQVSFAAADLAGVVAYSRPVVIGDRVQQRDFLIFVPTHMKDRPIAADAAHDTGVTDVWSAYAVELPARLSPNRATVSAYLRDRYGIRVQTLTV